MRLCAAIALFGSLCLGGCGYIGPVLPPSPDIPNAVTDLRAIQKGGQIEINFTVPPRTTDDLVIRRYEAIDLAIGPAETPFDFEQWSASAQHFELPTPPPADPDAPVPHPIAKALAATEWTGKHVVIAVRTSAKSGEHFSQWSESRRSRCDRGAEPAGRKNRGD